MNKLSGGVWMDRRKAVIITLKEDRSEVKTVHSGIEGSHRIGGEKKILSRFGRPFSNYEQKNERMLTHDLQDYLTEVKNELKGMDQVVLFGPADMKSELEKELRESMHPVVRSVESADKMTQNQMLAWVKKYYSATSVGADKLAPMLSK